MPSSAKLYIILSLVDGTISFGSNEYLPSLSGFPSASNRILIGIGCTFTLTALLLSFTLIVGKTTYGCGRMAKCNKSGTSSNAFTYVILHSAFSLTKSLLL